MDRLAREVRRASRRRQREETNARLAAVSKLYAQLNTTITALLLSIELAIQTDTSPSLAFEKLDSIHQLVETLRQQLKMMNRQNKKKARFCGLPCCPANSFLKVVPTSLPAITNLYPNYLQARLQHPFLGKGTEVVMQDKITVFYVDDNPKSSRLLTSVLEESGFRVIAKNDPLEALALCRHTYFDLALLDYEMPALSGARLAEEIKHLMPEVPVVLISSRSELPLSERAFVDAHFGFGTALSDLLWTMRILTKPKVFTMHDHLRDQRALTQWADST